MLPEMGREGVLRRVVDRLRELIAVEDPEERIEGSGEVILDPAYNERYRGERELQRLSRAAERDQHEDGE